MFGRLFKLIASLSVIIALGCEVTDSLSTEPNFGDSYTIVTDGSGVTPRLDADNLHVTVQYGGGCEPHLFDLHYQVIGDTTEIWLEHDANGDTCEAYLSATLQRPVSVRALETPNVVLLVPGGEVITLR